MNYNEVNKTTIAAVQKERQRSVFNNNWEMSGKILSSLAIKKEDIVNLKAKDESFLSDSAVFPLLLDQLNIEYLSAPDLVQLTQYAKAIEYGDTRAASFVHDTAVGRPTQKIENTKINNIQELTDEQLEFLLSHADVAEDEND